MTVALHDRLAAGVAALQAGDTATAVEELRVVAADPAFQSQPDLADLRARTCSLLAQALLAEGQLLEADKQVRTALGLLRHLADQQGQHEVRTLQEQIEAAIAATRPSRSDPTAHWVKSTPIAALLATATTADRRADLLLKKANAFIDAGDPAASEPLALQAIDEDPAVRTQVFARMTLARALPAEAARWLSEALSIADAHDEFTLVGAVARAARAQNVPLPPQEGVSR